MIDPEVIRDAALTCAGVLAMHAGPFATASTYSAAGRTWGVRIGDGRIDVHIVADQTHDLRTVGREVQAAVRAAADDYPGLIAVHIEDVTLPVTGGGEPTGTGATSLPSPAQRRRTP